MSRKIETEIHGILHNVDNTILRGLLKFKSLIFS